MIEILEMDGFDAWDIDRCKPILLTFKNLLILHITETEYQFAAYCKIFMLNSDVLDMFRSWPRLVEVMAPFIEDEEREEGVSEVDDYFRERRINIIFS